MTKIVMTTTRLEKDLFGELPIPADAYWGIHTARAQANFAFSGTPMAAELVHALAMVKLACCRANVELGYLDRRRADAIAQACQEVVEGRLDAQFPVDALQGGAGTSANMNVNEVVANRACELLGGQKGDYDRVHPIEHVNLHQSTNDVYPTALKVAAIFALRRLSQTIARTQGAFQAKEKAFAEIVTMGRTELQDAVPIALGGQFASFAEAFARDRWRTFKCEERLRVVNLGGTAVGTGLTAPRDYIFLSIERLRDITGLGLTRAEQVMDATANADCFVEVSGMLDAHAANLLKVSQDLRLLHFLREIALPGCQVGSSIMPGKVNPVMLEAAMSVAMKVHANHGMIAQAASHGTLQINEFLPLIALGLLESLRILDALNERFAAHVEGITANAEICQRRVDDNSQTITAFLPHLGYERCEALLQQFQREPQAGVFREFLSAHLGAELVERVLSPHNLMALGYRAKAVRR